MPLRGESVGTAYVRVLADGSGLPRSIKREFAKADGDFHDAGGSGSKEYVKGFEEDMKSHGGNSMSDALARALAHDDFTEKFFKGKNWQTFEQNMKAKFGKVGATASAELRKEFLKRGNLKGIENDVEKMVHDLNSKLGDLHRSEHAFIRLGQATDKFGLAIGRAFGKGSRNNFLNFFGSAIANIFKLVGLFPRLLGNIGELVDGFKEARAAGEGLWTATRSGLTTMAKDAEGAQTAIAGLFEAGPVGIIAFAAALLLVIPLLGLVSALISGIAAAVIAMAASISFAIVGAIVPLLGLLGPLGLAFGGVAAAILTLSKTEKAKVFAPLLADLKKIGAEVRGGFVESFKGGIGRISGIVRGFDTLFHSVGVGLGQVGNIFARAFNSPQFSAFEDSMVTFFPKAMRRLARIAVDLGDALGSIFIAAEPFALRFLRGLEQITEKFSDFLRANPTKLQHFFRQAEVSARHFWNLLKQVANVLADLLFSTSGKRAGDDIFQSLTKSLKKFDAFISPKTLRPGLFNEQAGGIKTPKVPTSTGPDPLAGFFKNGEKVANALGTIVVDLGKIFDQLDNPSNRLALQSFLTAFVTLSGLTVKGINLGVKFSPALNLGAITGWISGAKKKIGEFFHWFFSLGGSNGKNLQLIKPSMFLGWIPGVTARISGALGAIRDRAGVIFSQAGDKMSTAMHSAATRIGTVLGGIPARLGSIGTKLGQEAQRWADNIFNAFVNLPRDIANIFSGLGQMILNAIGHVDIASLLHGHITLPGGKTLNWATGGIADRAALRIIGEAGPEAVVPLNRPLSQVDPSVRWLSAIAQGLTPPPSTAGPGAAGKIINNEWHLTMPGIDPRAAAAELLNRMVASAY